MSKSDGTLRQLTELAIQFRDARDWKQFHTPKDLAINLALEAAELSRIRGRGEELLSVHTGRPVEQIRADTDRALVLTGGAATAASKSHRDVTGDAPVATADITRVVVKNGQHALMVQTKLAKATAARTHLVITLTPAAEAPSTACSGSSSKRVSASRKASSSSAR